MAIDFSLVADLNPSLSRFTTTVGPVIDVSSVAYFTAMTATHGLELWKSDGTTNGTVLVKDVRPGSESSHPSFLTHAGGFVYFQATNDESGNELWRSDGSELGTFRVKDIRPGDAGSNPKGFVGIGNTVYFIADDGGGYDLWATDGTDAGTVRVKDLISTTAPVNVNGELFFTANDGVHGIELWKSDGTEAGTVLVKDIHPGLSSGVFSSPLVNIGGTLFFTARDGVSGAELWKSDGTNAGTLLVKDVNLGQSGSNIFWLTNVNGTLFFVASDGVSGRELWKSDGTEAGTVLVKDIRPGSSSALSGGNPQANLVAVGNVLYFVANDGTTGYELWKSDGTNAGTTIVRNIAPGDSDAEQLQLENVNGVLYFRTVVAGVGKIWRTDGTFVGTVVVVDDYAPRIAGVGDTLYFQLFTVPGGVQELWKLGSGSTPELVKNIGEGTANSLSGSMTQMNGALYFAADDGQSKGLWKTDGTTAGTMLVRANIFQQSDAIAPEMINVNGTLYFLSRPGGDTLWKSDGTEAGTVLVKDIGSPGSGSSTLGEIVSVAGTVYFPVADGVGGRELWKSDGTDAGTVRVKDIFAGATGSNPSNLTVIGDTLLFRAHDGMHGIELWKTDGTEAGTVLVKDIDAGAPSGAGFGSMAVLGAFAYFSAGNSSTGLELWKTDGTEAGTVLVKDIALGAVSSNPDLFIEANGELYFRANDRLTGQELWKSNGTEVGTLRVRDVRSGPVGSLQTPINGRIILTNVNGTVFFLANDGASGYELWKSDGSESGTTRVKDIRVGPLDAQLSDLTSVSGKLFFRADDGVNGAELWASNGTDAGTFLVRDFTDDSGSSVPTPLAVWDGKMFVSAFTEEYGREVWMAEIAAIPELAGDYDFDDDVDGHDFLKWQQTLGSSDSDADGNSDGKVGHEDLVIWTDNFGQRDGSMPSNAALATWNAAVDALFAAGDFTLLYSDQKSSHAKRRVGRR